MSDPVANGTLSITLNQDGTVSFVYPENEMMARFLADKARSFIDMEFHRRNAMAQAQASQPRVISPNGGGGPIDLQSFKRRRG